MSLLARGFHAQMVWPKKESRWLKESSKKTTEGRDDFWLGLLGYRSCPLEDGRSPGELLFGRRLQTPLPDFAEIPSTPVRKHRQAEQPRRPLAPLQQGQVVRVRGDRWENKARVMRAEKPRSYRVETEDGKMLRRNRQHLLATAEPFRRESSTEDESDDERDNDGSVGQQASSTERAPGISNEASPCLRRSTRQKRPPQRLYYGSNFEQCS